MFKILPKQFIINYKILKKLKSKNLIYIFKDDIESNIIHYDLKEFHLFSNIQLIDILNKIDDNITFNQYKTIIDILFPYLKVIDNALYQIIFDSIIDINNITISILIKEIDLIIEDIMFSDLYYIKLHSSGLYFIPDKTIMAKIFNETNYEYKQINSKLLILSNLILFKDKFLINKYCLIFTSQQLKDVLCVFSKKKLIEII